MKVLEVTLCFFVGGFNMFHLSRCLSNIQGEMSWDDGQVGEARSEEEQPQPDPSEGLAHLFEEDLVQHFFCLKFILFSK